jgi:hypothetical protein
LEVLRGVKESPGRIRRSSPLNQSVLRSSPGARVYSLSPIALLAY